jgi:hypothetical protein
MHQLQAAGEEMRNEYQLHIAEAVSQIVQDAMAADGFISLGELALR